MKADRSIRCLLAVVAVALVCAGCGRSALSSANCVALERAADAASQWRAVAMSGGHKESLRLPLVAALADPDMPQLGPQMRRLVDEASVPGEDFDVLPKEAFPFRLTEAGTMAERFDSGRPVIDALFIEGEAERRC